MNSGSCDGEPKNVGKREATEVAGNFPNTEDDSNDPWRNAVAATS